MPQLSIQIPDVTGIFKHKHMTLAQGYIGVHEQSSDGQDNPTILNFFTATDFLPSSDETPWCAAFVNWVLRECGYEYTGKPNARSFNSWGVPVSHSRVKVGDVGVIEYGTWEGHVGFVQEVHKNGTLKLLGGNQKDEVSIKTYKISDFAQFRRLRSSTKSTTIAVASAAIAVSSASTVANMLGVNPETIEFVQGITTQENWDMLQKAVVNVAGLYIIIRKMSKSKANIA